MTVAGKVAGRGLLVVAVLAAFAAAGGCAVDEQKEVAQYRAVLDGDKPSAVEFTTGQPLRLDTALRLANAHNERLQLQGETYLQALIEKDRAFAAFLPTISLVPSFSKADDGTDRLNARGGTPGNPNDPSGGGFGFAAVSTGDSRLDVPVNLRTNLFNGFRDLAALRAQGAEIGRQRALLTDLQHTVLLEVAQTYYRVLRAERSVRVLRNSVTVQEERVRDARARSGIGMARPLDVAQFEAQAAATRVSLINAQNDVRNGRTLLAYLIDARVGDSPLVDEFELPAELPPVDQFLDEAGRARQDVRAAESAIAAAEQNVRVAVGQYYPSVTLNFNQYLYRESPPETSMWNGVVTANLPIFTGGIIHANVRTALSRLRQAMTALRQASHQAEQDVLIAHENVLAAAAREAELRVQFEAAQAALRLAEGRGQVGQGTNLERLIAQDQLLTAELQLSSQQFDRKVLYLNLLRAAGRLGTSAMTAVAPPTTAPATTPTAS